MPPPINPGGGGYYSGGGGLPPELMLGAGGGSQPGLLDMMQPGGGGGGTQDWAPSWVREQLPANLAAFYASQGGGGGAPTGGGGGGLSPFGPVPSPDTPLGGSGVGQLAPYLNPANWGPPPPLKGEPEFSGAGWFPEFNNLGPNPGEKFWTMKAFNQQYRDKYGGGDVGNDETPNTRNPQYAGAGHFMYLGHPISQTKLYYDLHRPVHEPEAGEVTGGSLFPARGRFGRAASAWSTKGQVGFPGQIDPFGVSWGAGGPG